MVRHVMSINCTYAVARMLFFHVKLFQTLRSKEHSRRLECGNLKKLYSPGYTLGAAYGQSISLETALFRNRYVRTTNEPI